LTVTRKQPHPVAATEADGKVHRSHRVPAIGFPVVKDAAGGMAAEVAIE
jgi:hypothetical protein